MKADNEAQATPEEKQVLRKGDRVAIVLRGAGVQTREGGYEVKHVKKGLAYIWDGQNTEDYGYDAKTGEWAGDDFMGFSRRIERERDE